MSGSPGARGGVRRRLAGGTLLVAVGLTVTGIGTVVMMAVAARGLSATQYSGFAVWWTVASLLGTCFGVFEAYLARLVVTARTAGRSSDAVVGILAGRAVVVVALLAAGAVVASPVLGSRLFAGHLSVALVLPLFTALAAAQSVQRGAATGHQAFGAIAAQLSCDGVVRALLVVVVVAVGAQSVLTLALACCTSAAASLVVGGALCPAWWVRPRLRGAGVPVRPLVYLLVGSVGPLLASNGSVPWLAGTGSVDAFTLGSFAAAVTLSRIPTQFVAAAFGPLLAQLAAAVESGDRETFHQLRRTADVAAAVLGLLFVVGFAAVGSVAIVLYLGAGYRLATWNLAVLAAASSVMFLAVVQQAGLAALDRWALIAVAWVGGTVGFLVVLGLPGGELARATLAPLVGVLVAFVLLVLLGRGSLATDR